MLRFNSKRSVLAAAVLGVTSVSSAPVFAAVLASESFNQANPNFNAQYPNDGTNIDGMAAGDFGFSGNYHDGSGGAAVETASLTNPSVSSQGNKLGRRSGNNNAYYDVADFNTTAGGNFASYLESSGGANASGNNIGATGNTLYFSVLIARATADNPSGQLNFLRDNNNGNAPALAAFTSGPNNPNLIATTTNPTGTLVVGEIVYGANNVDTFYRAINPTSGADLAQVGTGNFGFDRLEYVGNGDFQFDELRVGNSFADVVNGTGTPEPASIASLALGGLALLRRRRTV